MAIPGRHSQTFRWEWARGGGRKHVQVYSYYAVVYLLLFCLFLYCIILCICTSCNIVYVYKRGKARHKLNLEKGERMHLREWTLLGGKVGGGRGEGGRGGRQVRGGRTWRLMVMNTIIMKRRERLPGPSLSGQHNIKKKYNDDGNAYTIMIMIKIISRI
jgi:hypothetical protein